MSRDASGSRHLDLSSSTLFYREMDVVPMLSREQEIQLAVEQETVRHSMLSALLSIPPGRDGVLQPLRMLVRGRRVEKDVLDTAFWGMSQGVLPESRRGRLAELLPKLDGKIEVSVTRLLRPDWRWIEHLGNEVFASLESCQRLVERESEIEASAGMERAGLYDAAVAYVSSLKAGAAQRRAWLALPEIREIRRRLRIMELRRGVDIDSLFSAGRAFLTAQRTHRELLERLVESNLRLVVKWARKYCRTGALEEMDLVQEGCRGLLSAAMRYDYHRGYRFSTYAVWWVRQAILKALSQQTTLIRLPSEMMDYRRRINKAMQRWTETRGRRPTTAELAEELGMEIEQVRCLQDLLQEPLSADLLVEEREAIVDYIEDAVNPTEQRAYNVDRRRRIQQALELLSDRERTIISLRFGLFDGEPQTLEDVGRIFGVTRERIRQIESRALGKLRQHGVFFTAEREDERG
mgnify:CR=1 FL=1